MCREQCEACYQASSAACSALNPNSKLLPPDSSGVRVVALAARLAPQPKQGRRKYLRVQPHAHHTVFVSSGSPLELGGQKPPAENCSSCGKLQRLRLTYVVGK